MLWSVCVLSMCCDARSPSAQLTDAGSAELISWLLSCGINSKDAARYAASFASKGCDHPEDIRDVEDCDWPEIIKPVHSKKIRRRLGEEAGVVEGDMTLCNPKLR